MYERSFLYSSKAKKIQILLVQQKAEVKVFIVKIMSH
jgi:hypothetical protein